MYLHVSVQLASGYSVTVSSVLKCSLMRLYIKLKQYGTALQTCTLLLRFKPIVNVDQRDSDLQC